MKDDDLMIISIILAVIATTLFFYIIIEKAIAESNKPELNSLKYSNVSIYKISCYYPPSCYKDYDSFLSQFPNKTMLSPTICYYAIYCDYQSKSKRSSE